MKVAIVGAGAVGCLLAARLTRTPAGVTLIARARAAEAISHDGITMVTPLGRVSRVPVRVTDDALSAGTQDAVFLCVKAHALGGALDTLSSLMGPETAVVPMINGIPWWYPLGQPEPLESYRLKAVDPDGTLWRSIPSDRLVGAVTWVSVEADGVGRIRHVDDQRFVFGDPLGRRTAAVESVVELFGLAGFQARGSLDIRADIWTRLWGSLAFNPLSALTGATPGALCVDPGTRAVARTLMAEARAVAERLGITFTADIEARIAAAAGVGDFRTSMLQDMEAGKRLEVEAIVRSVAELGALVGVPTPTVETVAALVDMKARHRGSGTAGMAA
ncbi:2-dehydropantoate 2-reductase [Skermanella aerolata]|uniref:2-dehydropantoate 2-reductase n=1 Tax=Skermanella aerolata TaxID=393310 RepID=A0A512DX77_9PROT|nr:2-dehydropantoate 2-reductase [Skermanella aerolata]KJB95510.1 2-dehydropantoate 2-reductase [Skermanella aerolata KACC 11604]GEO40790.1 2-dehydropantoate 2-reductase [Skermanella aerolata]